MARPSAILERFWLQNDPPNGDKKGLNPDFGEIVIFATPPMRNQRFHCPGPLQKWCKISLKKDSATRPPSKSSIFNLRAPLDGNMNRKGFQKGFLLGRPGAPKIQKSSSKRWPKCGREPTPQNGPSFSLNGCQNILPKQYNLAQILSKEVSRNVLNETNSGK